MLRLAKATWYVLTLRCEEADRVRSIDDLADLTRAERTGERLHSLLCRSCRSARRQLNALSRVITDHRDELSTGSDEQLSEDARQLLEHRLQEEQKKLG
ncbi:MAG: hypothetical protein ACYTGC_02450 [Planctomycetota bacterium]|jgi:hypothetical protein